MPKTPAMTKASAARPAKRAKPTKDEKDATDAAELIRARYRGRGDDTSSSSSEDDKRDEDSESEEEEEAIDFDAPTVKGVPTSARDAEILAKRAANAAAIRSVVPQKNKQRVLVLCSRGVTSRHRHLMEDVRALLPHHRKEPKHDTKKRLSELNEICDLRNCNACVFFEARKMKDLYMWLTRSPTGPSLKFLIQNIHTMDELRLTGNCLQGSRPLLSFDSNFQDEKASAVLKLVRQVLVATFGTPRGHAKSKPFVDRVMHFAYLHGRVWVRNYQITDETTDAREMKKVQGESVKLVEIGPRFVMTLVKVFEGGFSGRPLYVNDQYESPNAARAARNRELGSKYAMRKAQQAQSRERLEKIMGSLPEDPFKDVFANPPEEDDEEEEEDEEDET